MKKNNRNQKIFSIKTQKKNYSTGFTLVEIIVTITVFSLIFGIVSSMFVSAIKSQKKSLVSQELLSQASYVMEYVSRHLRMAKNYNIASVGCVNNGYNYEITRGGNGVKFANYEDPSCCWEFYLENNRLNRGITGTGCYSSNVPLTSANLTVDKFSISLIDSEASDGLQPRLTLFLKIRGGGEKSEEQSIIEIQTTISQRALNEGDTGSGGGGFVCGDIVTDVRDNQQYGTILIGSQCWMTRNMNIGRFIDTGEGDQGNTCNDATDIEKYCYDDNEEMCHSDGGLYQWDQATCGGSIQGICPSGWHVPTDEELFTLEDYIKEESCDPNREDYDCLPAGAELQRTDLFNWLLAGYWPGSFQGRGDLGRIWSSSELPDLIWAWYREVRNGDDMVGRYSDDKKFGQSVRCVR